MIFLGVVNRVMRVELGLPLLVVSVLVGGGHYLGALVAIPFGGEVFGLDAAHTTRFNAHMGAGVILGILLAIFLLSRVGVAAFRREVAGFGVLAAQAMD